MKINLGSGLTRLDGFVNVDSDAEVSPDYVVDLEQALLPFEDSSVQEIRAHHIFEHIQNFIPLMTELYRVAKPNCVLDIVAPHHQHDVFYGDPTHVRPITVPVMYQFSKDFCTQQTDHYKSARGLAWKINVNWEITGFEFEYDPFYQDMLADFFERKNNNQVSQEEDFMIQRLLREALNVAIHTKIKMKAVK